MEFGRRTLALAMTSTTWLSAKFALFAGATGLGPYLSGLSHDFCLTYMPAFALYEILPALACLMIAPLGPYPFPG